MSDLVAKWEKAQKSYETKTADPDSNLAKNLPFTLEIAEILRGLTYLGPGTKLLDLASGNGFYAGKPQEETGYVYLNPDQHITKCDILEPHEMNGDFVRCDVEDLSFGSEMFDAVTCVFSLDHFLNPRAVFKEAKRILRPGGKFFVAQAVFHHGMDPIESDHHHHIYDFSVTSIGNLYFKTGFSEALSVIQMGFEGMMFFAGEKPNGAGE